MVKYRGKSSWFHKEGNQGLSPSRDRDVGWAHPDGPWSSWTGMELRVLRENSLQGVLMGLPSLGEVTQQLLLEKIPRSSSPSWD